MLCVSTATQFRQGGVSTPEETLIKQPILSPELKGEKGQCGCSAGSEPQGELQSEACSVRKAPREEKHTEGGRAEGRALTQ